MLRLREYTLFHNELAIEDYGKVLKEVFPSVAESQRRAYLAESFDNTHGNRPHIVALTEITSTDSIRSLNSSSCSSVKRTCGSGLPQQGNASLHLRANALVDDIMRERRGERLNRLPNGLIQCLDHGRVSRVPVQLGLVFRLILP